MTEFEAAIAELERMKGDGLLSEYAIGGGLAVILWSHPIATGADIELFVLPEGTSESLHDTIDIAELPMRVVRAGTPLAAEAVTRAAVIDYEGQPARIIRPEYLVLLYRDDRQRVEALFDHAGMDEALLEDLAVRYHGW